MSKYIIKQIPAEQADLSFYFDGDTFTERAGGIQYALFPLVWDRWSMHPVINRELWENITSEADELADAFSDVGAHYWNCYTSYKEAMYYAARGIKYTPRTCGRLKEWARDAEYAPSTSHASARICEKSFLDR